MCLPVMSIAGGKSEPVQQGLMMEEYGAAPRFIVSYVSPPIPVQDERLSKSREPGGGPG